MKVINKALLLCLLLLISLFSSMVLSFHLKGTRTHKTRTSQEKLLSNQKIVEYSRDLSDCLYEEDKCNSSENKLDKFTVKTVKKNRVGFGIAENTLFIGFRGTENLDNVITDLNIKTFDWKKMQCKAHLGFYEAFKRLKPEIKSSVLKLAVDEKVKAVVYTGHSLGGAIAQICSLYFNDLAVTNQLNLKNNLITFGAPRALDKKCAGKIAKIPNMNVNMRVVYDEDIVPQVPTTPYFHTGSLIKISNPSNIKIQFQKFDPEKDPTPQYIKANSDGDASDLFGAVADTLANEACSYLGCFVMKKLNIEPKEKTLDEKVKDHSKYPDIKNEDIKKMLAKYEKGRRKY
mmetsp:Transcript_15172/g.15724  ORF Transcript_15172/g.15724 Transcript_15172/m.15724 type:complete len:345 (+) Transcript_15172:17-1051(+)